jgi:hypothetical protein
VETEETEEEVAEVTEQGAHDIMDEILEAAEAHAATTKQFIEEFSFYGKTLKEWGVELTLDIPDNPPDPDEMKRLYVALVRNIQTCNRLYTRANSMLTALHEGRAIKKADITAALVKSYEDRKARRPAGTVIDKIAETRVDIGYLKTASKIARDFFKDHRDTLVEVRKGLEQLGFMMHLELKLQE